MTTLAEHAEMLRKWADVLEIPSGSFVNDDLRAAADALSSIPEQGVKRFPVLNSGGAAIDWRLVDDHGVQALKNHYQTVQRLAERGGLSWSELYAVLHDKPFRMMDTNDAITACRALEARYLAALVAPFQPAAVGVTDEMVERVSVPYDGFTGDVIGNYTTREGKQGVVVQQDGTRVVHVYGRSRVVAALRSTP